MKAFQLLIFAILIIKLYSHTYDFECEASKKPDWFEADKDTCMMLSTGQDATHCCYVEYGGKAECWELTDDEYENIKRFKDHAKELYTNGEKIKIKCSSNFVTNSLLSLLILILL